MNFKYYLIEIRNINIRNNLLETFFFVVALLFGWCFLCAWRF